MLRFATDSNRGCVSVQSRLMRLMPRRLEQEQAAINRKTKNCQSHNKTKKNMNLNGNREYCTRWWSRFAPTSYMELKPLHMAL